MDAEIFSTGWVSLPYTTLQKCSSFEWFESVVIGLKFHALGMDREYFGLGLKSLPTQPQEHLGLPSLLLAAAPNWSTFGSPARMKNCVKQDFGPKRTVAVTE